MFLFAIILALFPCIAAFWLPLWLIERPILAEYSRPAFNVICIALVFGIAVIEVVLIQYFAFNKGKTEPNLEHEMWIGKTMITMTWLISAVFWAPMSIAWSDFIFRKKHGT